MIPKSCGSPCVACKAVSSVRRTESLLSKTKSLSLLMVRPAAEYGQPYATTVHPSWHSGLGKCHGKPSILDSTLAFSFVLKHCAAARRAATDLWIQQEIPWAYLVHSSAQTWLSCPHVQDGICALVHGAAGSWVSAGGAFPSALHFEWGHAHQFCLAFTPRGNQSGHFIYPFGLFVFSTDRHCPLRL